jgi:RNA polymerase-interacting CarD/CdnL/TRCF family regulator
MNQFDGVCERLGVPIANEKTEGPTTILEYLGLTIDTQNMVVKIPADKVKKKSSK